MTSLLLLGLALVQGCGFEPQAAPIQGVRGDYTDTRLRFGDDGVFTIVQFTDTQDDHEMDPRTVRLMEVVLEDQLPDLVIFTGDNVRAGPRTPEEVWMAMEALAGPVESRKIPWLVTFGNHDEDHTSITGMDETALLERYMAFPNNVNQASPEGVNGSGNTLILIGSPDGTRPLLAVWALDSGRYAPDSLASQPLEADGLRTYDWIRPTQIGWYHRTSLALEEEWDRPVPGLMFFHIPLPEFDLMWENRDNHGVVGEKNEDVAAGAFNSGLLAAVMDRGDVMGIFVGHDHVNDFVGDYFGVRLGYAANAGFDTYGLGGEDPDRLRGARVFVVHAEDPAAFQTYMVYARDYGIQ